jgi:hypothetical protein
MGNTSSSVHKDNLLNLDAAENMFCDEYGSNVRPTDPAPPELLPPGLPALIVYTGDPLG